MDQRVINVIAGLLVPSLGSIVFNALNNLIEKGAAAPIPPTVYDVSIGCAFTVIGIAATQKKAEKVTVYFLVFVLLLFFLMGMNLVLFHLFSGYQAAIILLSNILSLTVVAISIWKS
jgi:hypothetical protein